MKFLKVSLITIILLAGVYCAGWFALAHYTNKAIMQFYVGESPELGIKHWGNLPEVQNFPKQPQIFYERGFDTRDFEFRFDNLLIEGFPIPWMTMRIASQDEVTFHYKPARYVSKIQAFSAEIVVPKSFPQSINISLIEQWQRDVGHIEISNFFLEHYGLIIMGAGNIGLDDNLQLKADIETTIFQYDKFIELLVSTNVLKPLEGIIALSIFDAIAVIDPIQNQKFVRVPITIQDRTVEMAGFRLPIKLNDMNWE